MEATKATFDVDYPEEDFRNIRCSIEYPVEKTDYPGIWLDFNDTDKLVTAGIAHAENTDPDLDGAIQQYARWKFTGYVSFTVVALSSLERDRLYDELVRVLAFGSELEQTRNFREMIETNDFLACNIDFDEIEPQGNNAAPGTPWGTDEVIYERSLNMEIIGEFVSNPLTGNLVPLSEIILTEALEVSDIADDEEIPDDWYGGSDDGPTAWH